LDRYKDRCLIDQNSAPEVTKAQEKDMKMKYRYAIYFTWNDGFEDTFNVYDAWERDSNIKDMIERKEFKEISYCRIYANGEYGKRIKVL